MCCLEKDSADRYRSAGRWPMISIAISAMNRWRCARRAARTIAAMVASESGAGGVRAGLLLTAMIVQAKFYAERKRLDFAPADHGGAGRLAASIVCVSGNAALRRPLWCGNVRLRLG